MKSVRKIICALLCFGLLSSSINTVFAAEEININNSLVSDSEKAAQEEIDDIFRQLNNLAAEKRAAEFFANNYGINSDKNTLFDAAKIASQEQQLNNRLDKLGVHKIDPNNREDMEHLEDVVLSAWEKDITMDKASSIPAPPDLSSLADCYSLYQYSGTTTVKGVGYKYSYIRVVDNKGYSRSPLTSSKLIGLIKKERMLLADLLSYNFSFGLSAFLGTTPQGMALDWTIGNVTTVFDSLAKDSPVKYEGNSDIYTMSILSVTHMQYCYVYIPSGSWMLCGVNAPCISFTRTESVVANVNGHGYSKSKDYPEAISSTGISPGGYAFNYVSGGMNFTRIDSIGTLTINSGLDTNGDGKDDIHYSTTFAPGFCSYPAHLG